MMQDTDRKTKVTVTCPRIFSGHATKIYTFLFFSVIENVFFPFFNWFFSPNASKYGLSEELLYTPQLKLCISSVERCCITTCFIRCCRCYSCIQCTACRSFYSSLYSKCGHKSTYQGYNHVSSFQVVWKHWWPTDGGWFVTLIHSADKSALTLWLP